MKSSVEAARILSGSRADRTVRRGGRARRLAAAAAVCSAWLALSPNGQTCSTAAAAEPAEPTAFRAEQLAFFESKVRPILAARCFECHGAKIKTPKGGLRLTGRAALIEGGDSGPAIVLDKPDESLLLGAVNYGELFQMPPSEKLPKNEIGVLTTWVRMGAPWPAENQAAANVAPFDLDARRASHWCWQPLRAAEIPAVRHGDWPADAIDRFILAKLEAEGMTPRQPTDRRTLLRRLSFDLTGLPPAPKEVQDFLSDDSPEAVAKVVDRLLASPRFGERWARHWMDLVRYAETHGHEVDFPIPLAHRYRDYLIRALNADVPYDQLVREHIAGDVLPAPRLHPTEGYNESIIATGFWWFGEAVQAPTDVLRDQSDRIDNQIDVMTKAFLGLTVGCARCHDHKFDAISTKDYYALAGFLQSSRRQIAPLDPRGRAAATARYLDAQQSEVAALLPSRVAGTGTELADQLRRSLDATREVFAAGHAAPVESDVQWEAEKLRVVAAHGGSAAVEGPEADGPQWSGQRQLAWSNVAPDGKLELEFSTDRPATARLVLRITKGPGHGAFAFQIDGTDLGPTVDAFAPAPSVADVDLGTATLGAGKHLLAARMLGPDTTSPKRFRFGLDLIRLEDAAQDARRQARRTAIDAIAHRYQLPPDLLSRWVDGLRQPEALDPSSPLYPWATLVAGMVPGRGETFVETKALWQKAISLWRLERDEYERGSERVADFRAGTYGDWFVTGEAFGRAPTAAGQWNPLLRGVRLVEPEVAHSGARSRRLRGGLRSPTFTLTKPRVHYRLASTGATIRLIIDGFFVIEYHSLLFRDAQMVTNTQGEFAWEQQAGDIGKYVGHRAYIEILDNGEGYAAIDEIRQADRDPPKLSRPHPLTETFLADEAIDSWEKLAGAYGRVFAEAIDAWRSGRLTARDSRLLDWLFRGSLIECDPPLVAHLAAKRHELDDLVASLPEPFEVLATADGTGLDARVQVRGNPHNLGPPAPRAFLTALAHGVAPTITPQSSGRLELAERMLDADNPLVARVFANRIWQHLLGRGIVRTSDNFGVLGEPPTHPELLDHLASSLRAEGWSLKRLIRKIVLSKTYQMSSERDAFEEADPNNRLWHRADVRRLEAEAIRDALLNVSGSLSPVMYGPGVPVHLTPFMEGRGRPGKSGPLNGNGRRSIYVEVRRNFLPPFMLAFDMPSMVSCIGQRTTANVPAQALTMLNDPFVQEQAAAWAKQVLGRADTPPAERIRTMYQAALSRDPTPDELVTALAFVDRQAVYYQNVEVAAERERLVWSDLCHVLFNTKDFLYVR